MKKMELGQALRAALLAALTAVLAQVQLPIGPVPFNLAVLGALSGGHAAAPGVGRMRHGRIYDAGPYWHPGVCRLCGRARCAGGKTGGYVLGYVCIAWCTAMARRFGRLWLTAAGMALGLVLCYALGTAWFMGMTGTGLGPSLAFCVWPFVVPDICKGACALAVGTAVAKRLSRGCRALTAPGPAGKNADTGPLRHSAAEGLLSCVAARPAAGVAPAPGRGAGAVRPRSARRVCGGQTHLCRARYLHFLRRHDSISRNEKPRLRPGKAHGEGPG